MMKSPSFRKYVVLSFLIHIGLVGGFWSWKTRSPLSKTSDSISIELLNPEQSEQVKKKAAVETPANQIVEQSETSQNEEAPENTRFLSAKNQKVEKQTIAAERGQFENKKTTSKTSGTKGDGKAKTAESAKLTREEITRQLFAKSFDPQAAVERQQRKDVVSGAGMGQGQENTSNGTGQDASKSQDYVKDVNVGMETLLNTREFKYYSYYSRIRKQLSHHWEGNVRERLSKLFKEGRSPAAVSKDRITKLMIVLNDRGTLVKIQVLSDSGIRDLDDAAIDAFRAAAPFPNPPKGIIETDGTVKIRWDFILET